MPKIYFSRLAKLLNHSGFTLIEILIAISILSLVGVLAIPNIKKFSVDQQLQGSYFDLKDAIKKAQSGAISSVECYPDLPSSKWSVEINYPTAGTTTYGVKVYCQDTSVGARYAKDLTALPSNILITSTTCSGANRAEIFFEKSRVYYSCAGASATTEGDFSITFSNTNNAGSTINLLITRGGAVGQI